MAKTRKLPETDDELAVLQEAALKTDGGQRFPAAAYAFVPDPEKPDTWKLRIWETLDKKVTRAQLGRASAAFSPGGFRGQRVQIPSGDVAKVKAKLRAEYRKLGVESDAVPVAIREAHGFDADKTIPHWIEEKEPMERTKLAGAIALEEGAFDEAKGELTLTIIRPGFNESKNTFYPEEILRRDAQVFAGRKMFSDHQKEKGRPEGSLNNWVAQVGQVFTEDDGRLRAKAIVHDAPFKEKLGNLQKAGLLKEMGVSIHASGKAVRTKVQGVMTRLVENIGKCRSVDFVTFAGAGGQVELFESDEGDENDVDLIDEAALRDRRPDLVELIESAAVEANNPKKGDIDMSENQGAEIQEKLDAANTKLQESTTTNEALVTERDELKGKLEEAQGKEARAAAQVTITEAIAKAEDLPKPTKERLAQQFAEADNADGIADAITADRKYLTDLAESGKPTNVGASKEQDAATHKMELVEAITTSNINSGMSPEDAKAAAEKSANR